MYKNKCISVVITISIFAFCSNYFSTVPDNINDLTGSEIKQSILTLKKTEIVKEQQIYESDDPYPYDEMHLVDAETYLILKNAYEKIDFYSEFENGNFELYDLYKEKYLQLLNCEITFTNKETNEASYLNQHFLIKEHYNMYELNLDEVTYYFFDMDGDGAPELCFNGASFTCIFKYNLEENDFVLWFELYPSNYQLNGSKKIRWDGLGTGLYHGFYIFDEFGQKECTIYFFSKPIYNNITQETEEIYIVGLPKYANMNQEEILAECKAQAFFLAEHGMYYFRVTKEQYGELVNNYFLASESAEKNLEKIILTHEELFGYLANR